MEKYKVYRSERFDKELSKFDKNFQNRVDNIEDQLVTNPFAGDPLGINWFREKRYGKYRIYYLIYENLKAVFMVGISKKKDQQKVINTIKLLLEFFREEIEDLMETNDPMDYLLNKKWKWLKEINETN